MRTRVLSRVFLGVLGVFAIVKGLEVLGLTLGSLLVPARDMPLGLVLILVASLPAIALFVAARVLLVHPPVRVLEESDETLPEETVSRASLMKIWHAVLTFCGVLILGSAIPGLVEMAVSISISGLPDARNLARTPWPNILGLLLRSALGVYLLLGAPHFIAWQLKKMSGMGTADADDARERPDDTGPPSEAEKQ